MKLRTLGLVGLCLMVSLMLVACGGSTTVKNNSETIETAIKEKTTITFWHTLVGKQEEALKKLTSEFERENPKVKVNLQSQVSYSNLQAKLMSTMQAPKALPTITQAYPGWLWYASKNKMLVNLQPYISNKKIGIFGEEEIKKELMESAQLEGVQYGLPFNKSTTVLFYNQDLLKKYGINVPKTLDELEKASKKVYEKSNHKVIGAGFDSLSNYYTTALKDAGINFDDKTDFMSPTSKAVIDYYFRGVKAGYFRIAGSDKYMSKVFANQKIAFYVASSAVESFIAQDLKFTYNVAASPTQHAIQQGADIYMFSQADAKQRTAAYLYEKFLAKTSSTVYLANQTGYIPVTYAGMKDPVYVKSKSSKLPAVIKEATEHLFVNPVQENSDAAYTQLDVAMQTILSNPGGKEEGLIKQGEMQLKNAWTK